MLPPRPPLDTRHQTPDTRHQLLPSPPPLNPQLALGRQTHPRHHPTRPHALHICTSAHLHHASSAARHDAVICPPPGSLWRARVISPPPASSISGCASIPRPLWAVLLALPRCIFPSPHADSLLYRPFPAPALPTPTLILIPICQPSSRQPNRPVGQPSPSPPSHRLPCHSRCSTCAIAIASPRLAAPLSSLLATVQLPRPPGVAPIQRHRTSADMKPGQPKHSHGQSARPIPSGSPFVADHAHGPDPDPDPRPWRVRVPDCPPPAIARVSTPTLNPLIPFDLLLSKTQSPLSPPA
jgi:hypothetical protein